ncbi:MAG: hypothetical protein LBF57_00680 [Holosporaceae bacterium]|jgi:F0F1-type ATP synthase membrane subunit b/b'|nr:hypothetical protein [Holosporaceae bacterium]
MSISPELSIIFSFLVFLWIFAKKFYPVIISTLDKYIQEVKDRICEAELLHDEASLVLKESRKKENEIKRVIEEEKKKSEEKIKELEKKNGEHLRILHERFAASLKAQLEAEYIKQKDLLIAKLSDKIIEKISERISSDRYKISTDFNKEDLRKISTR